MTAIQLPRPNRPCPTLSPNDRVLLAGLAQSATGRRLANMLGGINPDTAYRRIYRLQVKMGAAGPAQMVVLAIQWGVLEP